MSVYVEVTYIYDFHSVLHVFFINHNCNKSRVSLMTVKEQYIKCSHSCMCPQTEKHTMQYPGALTKKKHLLIRLCSFITTYRTQYNAQINHQVSKGQTHTHCTVLLANYNKLPYTITIGLVVFTYLCMCLPVAD